MRFFLPPGRITAARMRERIRHPLAVALLVSTLHGTNDAYAAFLHPLLPRIMGELGLSITLAAVLTMTLSISASLAQPLFGSLSDRRGRRLMIVLGPALTGVFLSLIGFAPSFGTLVLLLALGGLGSAAFHPAGAALAARVTVGGRSGMRHAVFSFGGAIGYAMGPLIAVALVARAGLEGLWPAMIPGLVLAAALYAFVPRDEPRSTSARRVVAGSPARATEAIALLGGPLGLLFGISAVSAFIQRVFLTFEPIVMAEAGKTETAGAIALSLYLGAQAIGTLTGGWLTDRVDRGRLLILLTLLGIPAHFLAFWFPAGETASLVFVLAAGALNMAVLPPIVVIAQEVAPGRAARNSGIVMGLAWAAGSVAVLAVGILGDAIGPRNAALAATPLGLVAAALALHRRLDAHRRPLGRV